MLQPGQQELWKGAILSCVLCAGLVSAWEFIAQDLLPQHIVPIEEVPVSCDTTMDDLHSLFRCGLACMYLMLCWFTQSHHKNSAACSFLV